MIGFLECIQVILERLKLRFRCFLLSLQRKLSIVKDLLQLCYVIIPHLNFFAHLGALVVEVVILTLTVFQG